YGAVEQAAFSKASSPRKTARIADWELLMSRLTSSEYFATVVTPTPAGAARTNRNQSALGGIEMPASASSSHTTGLAVTKTGQKWTGGHRLFTERTSLLLMMTGSGVLWARRPSTGLSARTWP